MILEVAFVGYLIYRHLQLKRAAASLELPMITTGLIGDMGMGKTTTIGGIYKAFSSPPPRADLSDIPNLDQRIKDGLKHTVSFHIADIPNPNEKRTLNDVRDLLSSRPIRYPDKSLGPPKAYTFSTIWRTDDIDDRTKATTFSRTIRLLDVAGEHIGRRLSSDGARLDTLDKLRKCKSFIVFIDIDSCLNRSEDFYKRAIETVQHTLADAAKQRDSRYILPISVLLTKADTINTNPGCLFTEFVERIAKDISDATHDSVIMACPISVRNPINDRFYAFNLEYPFLFSTLGAIFYDACSALHAADYRTALYNTSVWDRFKLLMEDGKFANTFTMEAKADLELAKYINDYLELVSQSESRCIQFIRQGQRRKLSDALVMPS